MRLHRLQITAFGPFAGTVGVDFDELSDAGLFLLGGPTGAGKTSVLDAVCFGLYGEVPGDRAAAKHLRCDHADADAEPRVVLDVSIAGRSFRFTRSPAWQRPKKRGTGTIRVPAHVLVEEQTGGSWSTLSTRLDDAGLLVTDLLGMSCTQFTQVAMLPQGRFQAFLRATSTERHAVLQRLFRTRRFEDVERWLVEHRLTLRRTGQAAQERTAALVNRIQEAAEAAAPDGWDLHDLALPAGHGEVAAWAEEQRTAAEASRAGAATELGTATDLLAAAAAACDRAERIVDAHSRAATARRVLVDAAALAPAHDRLRSLIDEHHRALPVAALARHAAEKAASALTTARDLRAEVLAAADLLGRDDDSLTEEELAHAHRVAAESKAVAEAFAPREAELEAAAAVHAEASVRVDALESELTSLQERAAVLPTEVLDLEDELAAAAAEAAGLAPAEAALAIAEQTLVAARREAQLNLDLTDARAALQALTDRAHELREAYHDVREARINGMAAELALDLASGCGCPVCGSADHPAPAASTGSGVGRAEEDAARKAHEEAAFARQAQQEAVSTLATELAVARTTTGGRTLDHVTRDVDERRALVEAASSAGELVASLTERLESAKAERHDVDGRLTESRVALAAGRSERDQAARTVATLTGELAKLLAVGTAASCIAELVAEHSRCAEVFERARAAVRAHEVAQRAAEQAAESAQAAAVDAGFADAATAAAAVVADDALDEAVAELEQTAATVAAANATLADPVVAELLASEVPDPLALEQAHLELRQRRDRAGSAYDMAQVRVRRLTELCGELDRALADWRPLREAYAVAAELSAFVEGKGADNPQRVRLSAYVLSERLRQVVAAANERLGRMSDQRYSLEHTDDRGAGEQRGGLSLLVCDEWNGLRRDPATLSGGETFVVSLALALGLADTVSHEAGGTDIDTLFIDEGFGALDPETLEQVMDTLDTLRDGGRVVGLVSHVAELRTRIPTQLEIIKSRNGSTIRRVRAAG